MMIQQQVRITSYLIVLLDKFRSTMREEQAFKALEDARTQNAIIEEIIDKIRNENPQFDIILSRLIGW